MSALTVTNHVNLYNETFGARFPDSRLQVERRMMAGMWMLGNNYKGSGF